MHSNEMFVASNLYGVCNSLRIQKGFDGQDSRMNDNARVGFESAGRKRQMRIQNIYSDKNGDTHFREIEIELTEVGPDGTTSTLFPAKGIIFRTTPGDWVFNWHRATRRQYAVNLNAPHQVTASDGDSRIIGAGEIYLIEDLFGKGHLSRGLGQFRHSLLIPID